MEHIYKAVDIVLAQSNDLWPISTGLLLVAFGMLASPGKTPTDKRPFWALTLLVATILLCIASLFFGYVVKGSLISNISQITKAEDWEMERIGKWSFWQMFCTVLSAVAFAILLVAYRTFSVEALSRYMGK